MRRSTRSEKGSAVSAILPEALRPFECQQLERLGAAAGGGYVVERKSVADAKFLVSCGVNEDWSFEEEFCAISDVPIVALDGSVGREYFREQVRKAAKRPWKLLWHWNIYRSYRRFYSGQRKHLKLYVGAEMPGGNNLCNIVSQHVPHDTQPIFIKMDIEGSEYGQLDDLQKLAPRLSGMAIEFHDVHLHLDQIVSFVNTLPLRLAHVHINNNGGISDQSVPRVIECSFSRHCGPRKSQKQLPLSLDQANWYKLPDFRLEFR